ncbi:outer membrane protein [Legionella oakridgensis ATCC 33761 = DSM 21215]|uniref:Outer membrane protein n=1 Tax=Legionella oakridgensis ATCC 33761 = DSM 21215 TaxID=1268635 RepID=W0BE06_9GAMM|nr:TolC family protein [Legionella oakridgensis]AHE68105.1 outer membrane protein [Legionella oakridgensis ATCC 33761 = DSM 21215]
MRALSFLIFLAFSQFGFSQKPVDLLNCFADAARNDPTYQAQLAIYKAQIQILPEKFSALLPQITLNADLDREYRSNSFYPGGNFNTDRGGLLASQTIFNFTQFKQLAQAKYSVQSAYATLCAQQQDLMIRTATAFFDVLRARDLLSFTEIQKNTFLSN